MIILATQKNKDVEPGDEGRGRIVRLRARASASGQPRVENGQSPEENQVSSTSGSRMKSLPPHIEQSGG